MHERPIKDLVDALAQLGVNINYLEKKASFKYNIYFDVKIGEHTKFKIALANKESTDYSNRIYQVL